MRLTILALFLCAGTPAFCQSAVQAPESDTQVQKAGVPQPWTNLNKRPADWFSTGAAPAPADIAPHTSFTWQWNAAAADRKAIFPSPWPALVAKNELPGLPFRFEQIPTHWPNAKMEPIPTQYSGLAMVPIHAK